MRDIEDMPLLLSFLLIVTGLLPFEVEAPSAFFAAKRSEEKRAVILFGGDMMFDRSIRVATEKSGDDFALSCIKDTLQDADIVVANLEGPITTHASMSVDSDVDSPENVTFTFPTSTAKLLARHNIKLVNLGNNHILNFGAEGVTQTRNWLQAAGVQFFGDPGASESDRVARLTSNGIHFSFVNWSDWTTVREPTASNGAGFLNPVVEQVRKEAESGRVVIVYAHWGDEYVEPPQRVRDLAHSFIDAGAEVVIGSHPHVIQENELYGEKHIYYSLGNFIFDQYWDEEVRTGLLLKIVFSNDGVKSIEEIKTHLERDRRTCPLLIGSKL